MLVNGVKSNQESCNINGIILVYVLVHLSPLQQMHNQVQYICDLNLFKLFFVTYYFHGVTCSLHVHLLLLDFPIAAVNSQKMKVALFVVANNDQKKIQQYWILTSSWKNLAKFPQKYAIFQQALPILLSGSFHIHLMPHTMHILRRKSHYTKWGKYY